MIFTTTSLLRRKSRQNTAFKQPKNKNLFETFINYVANITFEKRLST